MDFLMSMIAYAVGLGNVPEDTADIVYMLSGAIDVRAESKDGSSPVVACVPQEFA